MQTTHENKDEGNTVNQILLSFFFLRLLLFVFIDKSQQKTGFISYLLLLPEGKNNNLCVKYVIIYVILFKDSPRLGPPLATETIALKLYFAVYGLAGLKRRIGSPLVVLHLSQLYMAILLPFLLFKKYFWLPKQI